jgi:hypothetical protein
MQPRTEQVTRWFVGLSLLLGGIILLAGAAQFGTFTGAPAWIILLAALVSVGLAVLTSIEERGPRSPMVPAAAWILSVLFAMLWARLHPYGHVFLSGYAAVVAFGTGLGILRRQLWAWPVALASVVGFGPIVLLLIPSLSGGAVAAAFVLFAADVIALLAIHRSYFGPR